MLVYNGEMLKDNLKKTKISVEELEESLREHGASSVTEVNLAILELDGNISVISNDFQSRSKQIRHRRGKLLNRVQSIE
jgi:uncharacterized membrane protein YcaP (DUF421 family)